MSTTATKQSATQRLEALGQSLWLDYIHRKMIRSGELARLIEDDGLRGVTSNPTIFEKAIGHSNDYDEDIAALASQGRTAAQIYEQLAVTDVREAADVLRGVYDNTDGRDGFVSLEVSPHLARDTQGTIAEARRLWRAVFRPNVLIKIPGTLEGLAAIRACIGEGINVNVTLLFGLPRYRQVANAYIDGLEDLARGNRPINRVASVASFFISRIDTLVDAMLEKLAKEGNEPAAGLRGQTAIACAKVAYKVYTEVFGGTRFGSLATCGGRSQRLLWASTSTKNPDYPDTKYVEPLIGPDTINTMPTETLDAYRDHGQPQSRLTDDVDGAEAVLSQLAGLGVSLDGAADTLEEEGIAKFNKPYDDLMETLKRKGAKG